MQCALCRFGKMNHGLVIPIENQAWFCCRLEEARDPECKTVLVAVLQMLARKSQCPIGNENPLGVAEDKTPYPDAYLSDDNHGRAIRKESALLLTVDVIQSMGFDKNT